MRSGAANSRVSGFKEGALVVFVHAGSSPDEVMQAVLAQTLNEITTFCYDLILR